MVYTVKWATWVAGVRSDATMTCINIRRHTKLRNIVTMTQVQISKSYNSGWRSHYYIIILRRCWANSPSSHLGHVKNVYKFKTFSQGSVHCTTRKSPLCGTVWKSEHLIQRFSNCGPPGGVVGPLGGGSCLYEGHTYFERNMGAT
jgi:hypothetical protein